jgi:hypothetical protein
MVNRKEPRTAVADFAQRLPQAVSETHFTVFICGPTPTQKSGGALRRYVSNRISKLTGVTVVWAEHPDFQGSEGNNIHLKKFNDVTKELNFALEHSDLTIIFPDSPGSFVELGIFGMHPKVCPQLLILFDRKHKGQKGFVINAMGESAKTRSATVKFVRYHHRRIVSTQLETIVFKKQQSKYTSKSYAPH